MSPPFLGWLNDMALIADRGSEIRPVQAERLFEPAVWGRVRVASGRSIGGLVWRAATGLADPDPALRRAGRGNLIASAA